ncbi:hypothetical protein L2725_00315 [Shewanella corallii]|uniref:LysM domain-containing protein n=1 Tax=Shewanella corallii TaxID=560080 RepID=A0ABT0N280_9GAMM|nr:hypothetical protein [Shewanella corallii]MCL2912235.1 hypothetical protein [Shewanella corallii]
MLRSGGAGFLGLLLLLLTAWPASAEIEHISLNKLQFLQGESVKMRINLVAEPKDLRRLEFVLWQESGPEKLMVQRLSPYLVELMGFEKVVDPNAYIMVRVYLINRWEPMTRIALFNELDALPDYSQIAAAVENPAPAQIKKDQLGSGSDLIAANCTIDYQPGETLWRIGTRYAKTWNSHVYGAILAIFEANKGSFYKSNIKYLKKNAHLECPAQGAWNGYGSKAEAEQMFEQLSTAN